MATYRSVDHNPNPHSGFIDANGQHIQQHDRVEHLTGRQGRLMDCTQDGDAFVLFDGDIVISDHCVDDNS